MCSSAHWMQFEWHIYRRSHMKLRWRLCQYSSLREVSMCRYIRWRFKAIIYANPHQCKMPIFGQRCDFFGMISGSRSKKPPLSSYILYIYRVKRQISMIADRAFQHCPHGIFSRSRNKMRHHKAITSRRQKCLVITSIRIFSFSFFSGSFSQSQFCLHFMLVLAKIHRKPNCEYAVRQISAKRVNSKEVKIFKHIIASVWIMIEHFHY